MEKHLTKRGPARNNNRAYSKVRLQGLSPHNKETGRKKLDKKSKMGFLMGYKSRNIYRIYHPATKELKVSRDVIFRENKFFDMRHVRNKDDIAGALELGITTKGPRMK